MFAILCSNPPLVSKDASPALCPVLVLDGTAVASSLGPHWQHKAVLIFLTTGNEYRQSSGDMAGEFLAT